MCIENLTIHTQFWKTSLNPSINGSPKFPLTKNASTAQNMHIKRHSTKAVTVTTFHIRLLVHPVRQGAGPDNATSSGITHHTAGTWKQTLENASFPSLTSTSLSLTPYTKIFNRNTIKLSYSCMNNVKLIISSHNKSVIRKSTNSDNSTNNCNCWKPEKCPMDGNCNVESIIYLAEVTSQTTRETYIGLCDTAFKLRYRSHTSSFCNER